MKLIVVLFVVVAMAMADDSTHTMKELLLKADKECQEDPATRLDAETVENLRKFKKVEYSDQFGAHTLCVSKKVGNQKADGEIDQDGFKSNLERILKDSEKANEIFNLCAEKKESPEKTAVHLYSCVRHAVPKPEHN